MTRDLANFLAKAFVPNFVDAHAFFGKLTAEAKQVVPNGRMVVLTRFFSEQGKHKFSFVEYPEDVYRELGLTMQS